MTIVPHKVAATTFPKGDERYAKARERLRKQLGDGKVYEECNAWALKLCSKAEQYDWPSRPQTKRTLDIGKSAAKLADYLEFEGQETILSRQLENGKTASLSAPVLAIYMRMLAEECSDEWLECGPLQMKFTNSNQIKMPPKAVALTLALTHGFRTIPKWPGKPVGRYGRMRGGQPCLAAAVMFANAALKAIKEETNVKAVKQWIKNNRNRFQYNFDFVSGN